MRFGAVGKKGSIAIIERFILTLKSEYLRRILVSLSLATFAKQLEAFTSWHNEHRPDSLLGGNTPDEVLFDRVPARTLPRFEPR